ncbi:hypothetical protein D3C81_2181300 [compost metagenome]
MTEHDVAQMRSQQRLEEAERDGNLDGIEDELETLRWLDSRRLEQTQQHDDDIVCEGFDPNLPG